MLVLTRKSREAVVVSGPADFHQMLKVTVLEIRHGRVKLGFDASEAFPVHRWEVWKRICAKAGRDSPLTVPVGIGAG